MKKNAVALCLCKVWTGSLLDKSETAKFLSGVSSYFFRTNDQVGWDSDPLSTRTVQTLCRAGPRGRAREWATLGIHPLSWLHSNKIVKIGLYFEKYPAISAKMTFKMGVLHVHGFRGWSGAPPSKPIMSTPSRIKPLAYWYRLTLLKPFTAYYVQGVNRTSSICWKWWLIRLRSLFVKTDCVCHVWCHF